MHSNHNTDEARLAELREAHAALRGWPLPLNEARRLVAIEREMGEIIKRMQGRARVC